MIVEVNGRKEAGLCWMCLEKKENMEECDIFSSTSKAISQPMQPQFQVIPRLFALLQVQKTLNTTCNSKDTCNS
jgi:hypothetical protein